MVREVKMGLIEECKTALADNLLSVINFGTEGQPNNILIVVKKLEFDDLDKVKPVIREYARKHEIVPIIFTKNELLSGSDVFPLEFLDIKYPHEVLYGEDFVNKIKFDKKCVRRQLEFELRSKLIHLRENYIGLKDAKELKGLLRSAVPTLMPLFYGLLFLKDRKIPPDLDSLLNEVESAYSIDLKLFKDIREDKISNESIHIKRLMDLLHELIQIIDKM